MTTTGEKTMTNEEARKWLEMAFPDKKTPDGRYLDNHPADFDRDPTKHLRQYAGCHDDDGWYIYADFGGALLLDGDYEPEILEALAMWLRDSAAVVKS